MIRKTFNELKITNPDIPIEIFCSKKHEGYSLRGQMKEIPFVIFQGKKPNVEHYYRFVIMGLINEQYVKNLQISYKLFPFGKLIGRNRGEYKKLLRKNLQRYAEDCSPDLKEQKIIVREKLEYYDSNPTLDISKKLFHDVLNTNYVSQLIEQGSEIILLELGLWIYRTEEKLTGILSLIDSKSEICLLNARLFSAASKYKKGKLIDWLTNDLLELLHKEYHHKNSIDVATILKKSARFINEWMDSQFYALNERIVLDLEDYKKRLNDFMDKINYVRFCGIQYNTGEMRKKIENDPVKRFYFRFLDDFIDLLVNSERKYLKLCINCGRFFSEKQKRKFCSTSCRIKYYSRYDDLAHKEERRKVKREYMRKKRAKKRTLRRI